jgi:predicted DsbA family dithiol-disulfide isomerase
MSTPAQIRIDIVSDVVCPWCIIGFKQLERAIGQIGDRADVSVRWHPFELAPNMPEGGQNIADYTRERYGATPEQGRANRAKLVELGTSLGIDFRMTPESRIFNSFKAHQLLCWAGESGGQTALKLELFKAYFTDQADINDDAVLMDAVERAGLDQVAAQEVLQSGRFADQVRQSEAYWQDQNVAGVPAYVINGKYMVPGAQDAETFVRVIDRVIARESEAAI